MNLDEPRTPPHNIECEQALLGALFVNNEACDRVSDFLEAWHFFDPLHGRIYETAANKIRAGRRVTPVTLKTDFENEEPLGELTVPKYLGRLAANATSVINAKHYAETIVELAVRRELIFIAESIAESAHNPDPDTTPTELVEKAEQDLAELANDRRQGGGAISMDTAVTRAIDTMARVYANDRGMAGLPTGFTDLDNRTGGLCPSDLIIVAARPGMGKTALACQIAFHNAKLWHETKDNENPEGCPTGIFSLEMSAEQLAARLISANSQIAATRLRKGAFSKEEFDVVVDVAQRLVARAPIEIDDTGGLNIDRLCARARRMKRSQGIGLLVIDYLQLLQPSRKYAGQRVNEVTELTTKLKGLAKELNIPIICLSQLSRQVETRDDKRPRLADLRESGSIEQDADVVMFIYREEYYVQQREPKEHTEAHIDWLSDMEKCQGIAEIIVGKQRHGACGTERLYFEGKLTRFSNLEKQMELAA